MSKNFQWRKLGQNEKKKKGNSGTNKDPKEIKNEFESINEDQSEQEQDDKETQ